MELVVLGGAGFVGHAVARHVRKEGLSARFSDVVPDPFGGALDYVQTDVLDAPAVRELVKGAEVVVHLAAHSLTASLQSPKENARVNIEGTLTILDACRAEGVQKVVFTSASSLYGAPRSNPVDEAHPPDPQTPYAVAKLACEHYLAVYQRLYGLDYIAFRLFNVYGPGQSPASGALIPAVLDRIRRGMPVIVFGDGRAGRDFIIVDDVARFLVQAQSPIARNQVVNLGTGRLTAVREVVELCGKALGKAPLIDSQAPRPGEILNFCADTSRLESLFGRLRFVPVEEGIERTARALVGG